VQTVRDPATSTVLVVRNVVLSEKMNTNAKVSVKKVHDYLLRTAYGLVCIQGCLSDGWSARKTHRSFVAKSPCHHLMACGGNARGGRGVHSTIRKRTRYLHVLTGNQTVKAPLQKSLHIHDNPT
jgi:hypothetical protein